MITEAHENTQELAGRDIISDILPPDLLGGNHMAKLPECVKPWNYSLADIMMTLAREPKQCFLKESWRRNHGGAIWEASWRHLGGIWKESGGI